MAQCTVLVYQHNIVGIVTPDESIITLVKVCDVGLHVYITVYCLPVWKHCK